MLRSKISLKMKDHGFTLVELMIVVAIIGILASIAIPNFQKYQARARQREANIALGGVYTALKSYVAEVGTYTACLRQAGYAPENSNGNVQSSSAARYYLVGFSVGSITGTGLCGTGTPMTSCNAYQWDGAGAWITACTYTPAAAFGSAITASDIQYAANASARSGVTVGDANLAISFIDKNNFIAAAAGNISTSVNTVDLWSINEGKYLRNFTNGAN